MTIEQPFRDGSVFRVSYVFTHGENLDQNYQYNNAPSTYVWETATGTTPPTGTLRLRRHPAVRQHRPGAAT